MSAASFVSYEILKWGSEGTGDVHDTALLFTFWKPYSAFSTRKQRRGDPICARHILGTDRQQLRSLLSAISSHKSDSIGHQTTCQGLLLRREPAC